MSKKRRRQVAFNEEVTVVRPLRYPKELAEDAGGSEQKRPKTIISSALREDPEVCHEESVSLKAQDPITSKPGSRLRDQLESDSEPDDDDDLNLFLNSEKEEKTDKAPPQDKDGLGEEDLFAQEEATLHFDGDIKVTPFNVDEEMEEGRFDAEGNYYTFKEEEVHDNWLTDIDWSRVDEQGEIFLEQRKRGAEAGEDWKNFLVTKEKLKGSNESSVNQGTELTKNECMSRIISILRPRETVSQAFKRLKSPPAPPHPLTTIREKTTNLTPGEDMMGKFLELTELADLMCFHGEYDIYSTSFEKLQLALLPEPNSPPAPATTNVCGTSTEDTDAEISWEYKTGEESGKLYGPFKSSQMLAWSKAGYFDKGVLVRRIDKKEGLFYDSKRIDFDLYI